jgi:hypothetical protein
MATRMVLACCLTFVVSMALYGTYCLGRRSTYVLIAEQQREIDDLASSYWNDDDDGIKTLEGGLML